jgi:hypothetical protein
MGKVQIRGDVIGGQSSFTGFIISAGAIDSLAIGRSLAAGVLGAPEKSRPSARSAS